MSLYGSALEFSEDSKHLISAGHDGRINFWDLKSRSLLLSFNSEKVIEKVALVKSFIVSRSSLNHIDLWDVESQCHALSFQPLFPSKRMIINYKGSLFYNENLEPTFKAFKLCNSYKNYNHKTVALLKRKYAVIKVHETFIMVYSIMSLNQNIILE